MLIILKKLPWQFVEVYEENIIRKKTTGVISDTNISVMKYLGQPLLKAFVLANMPNGPKKQHGWDLMKKEEVKLYLNSCFLQE